MGSVKQPKSIYSTRMPRKRIFHVLFLTLLLASTFSLLNTVLVTASPAINANTVGDTETATVSHFTAFTLIGGVAATSPSSQTTTPSTTIMLVLTTTSQGTTTISPIVLTNSPIGTTKPITTAPTSTPSAPDTSPIFNISDLRISPVKIISGESTTISVLVTNTSDFAGNYDVVLWINGAEVARKSLTMEGTSTETVTFSTSQNLPGVYLVEVNGLLSFFTVQGETQSLPNNESPVIRQTTIRWWVFGAIAFIFGFLISFTVWFNRRKGAQK